MHRTPNPKHWRKQGCIQLFTIYLSIYLSIHLCFIYLFIWREHYIQWCENGLDVTLGHHTISCWDVAPTTVVISFTIDYIQVDCLTLLIDWTKKLKINICKDPKNIWTIWSCWMQDLTIHNFWGFWGISYFLFLFPWSQLLVIMNQLANYYDRLPMFTTIVDLRQSTNWTDAHNWPQ